MSPCQTFIELLRAQGFRITHQRQIIVEAIAHSGNHVDAEQVFAHVQQITPSANIATVYRTLDLLVSQGLASRIDLGKGRVIYATNQHGPHIHLVCRQCGQVIDADQNLLFSLNEQLSAGYQFAADLQHISVPGLCNCCQANRVPTQEG
ncbi:MAG: Fur family transcriptional regulator [Acidobacteriaceae bacterium]